jgi:hypothetical protein
MLLSKLDLDYTYKFKGDSDVGKTAGNMDLYIS